MSFGNPRPKPKYKIPMDEKPRTRRYCVLPARVAQDDELHYTSFRVLMAYCLHANQFGICWPSQTTIGRHVSRHPQTVSNHTVKLIAKGYMRRLRGRPYGMARKGKGWVNRYQILYDGPKTLLPNKEQIFTPRPRLIDEQDADYTARLLEHKGEGLKGLENLDWLCLAQAFCKGVETASGVHREQEPQKSTAIELAKRGVEPDVVQDLSHKSSLARLSEGRQPPLTLKQVAEWCNLI